jgi:hypothetical protein
VIQTGGDEGPDWTVAVLDEIEGRRRDVERIGSAVCDAATPEAISRCDTRPGPHVEADRTVL